MQTVASTVYRCTSSDGNRQYADALRNLSDCRPGSIQSIATEAPPVVKTHSTRPNVVSRFGIPTNAALETFAGSALQRLRQQWANPTATFNILHLGDSHVQSPDLAAALRIELARRKARGINYQNIGIKGTGYTSINLDSRFFSLAKQPSPDLLILDWGTNDLVASRALPAMQSQFVIRTIQMARHAYPDAAILLTSAQAMNYRGLPVEAAADYSVLMRGLARQNGCQFFDWYTIAGGRGAVPVWSKAGLLQRDAIHLTADGYRRKGMLLARAIVQALEQTD